MTNIDKKISKSLEDHKNLIKKVKNKQTLLIK